MEKFPVLKLLDGTLDQRVLNKEKQRCSSAKGAALSHGRRGIRSMERTSKVQMKTKTGLDLRIKRARKDAGSFIAQHDSFKF